MIRWMIRTSACLHALPVLSACLLGCDKPPPPPPSAAEQRALDSLTPAAVSVGNGQAAILKTEAGFGLLIPRVKSRHEGSYELLFSASGNFTSDAVSIEKKSGTFGDMNAVFKGHRLSLYGESDQSIWVQLAFGDKKILIASVPSNDPKILDLSKVRYEATPEASPEEWKKLLREKGVLK
jgi:hypothetical protein